MANNKIKDNFSARKQKNIERRTHILPNGKIIVEPISKTPFIVAGIVVAIVVALLTTVNLYGLLGLFTKFGNFFYMIGEFLKPDWSILPSVWEPLASTIGMTFMGSFIGTLLAVPVAFLASSNITHNKVVVAIMRFILGLVRTIPTLVVAMIAVVIFSFGTLAACIAIILFTFSFIGKLLYQHIETIDMGPYEAMLAMGCTKIRAFRCAVIPQIAPTYLANSLYCFEGNIRYSTILTSTGAGGLGLLLYSALELRQYNQVGAMLIVLFGVVAIIEIISRICRSRLS